MSEQRKLFCLWIMLLTLGLLFGVLFWSYISKIWFRFDTETIKLLAENSQSSETRSVWVNGTNGRGKSYDDIQATEFRDILLTLAPLDEGSRKGVLRFPQYQFLFQIRMDPTVIHVRELTPTSLEFEIQGIIYHGGNGMEFKRRIEAIINPSHVNPPAPILDATSESD